MTRVEHLSDGVTLYCGDNVDVLAALPRSITIVSDPPYGIDYNRSGGNRFGKVGVTGAAKKRGSPKIHGDDKPFDPAPLLVFDNVLIFGADHFYPRLPDRGRFLAWNKLGDLQPWDSFSDVEFAWHSREGAARVFSMMWKGIACDKRGENGGLREHPTQKPVRLMIWAIEQAGGAGLVCDPYMGAGSTGVAAVRLARPFVGVEIEPRYFDIACRRIAEALRQGELFGAAL